MGQPGGEHVRQRRWRLASMKPADAFLDGTVLDGQGRVRAQGLRPALDRRHVDIMAGFRGLGAWPLLVQYLVYQGDRDRSLAHCRSHALDIASANVTDREHSG